MLGKFSPHLAVRVVVEEIAGLAGIVGEMLEFGFAVGFMMPDQLSPCSPDHAHPGDLVTMHVVLTKVGIVPKGRLAAQQSGGASAFQVQIRGYARPARSSTVEKMSRSESTGSMIVPGLIQGPRMESSNMSGRGPIPL